MAAFFICRDFNARPGLAWHWNDRAIIIPPGRKRDEARRDDPNDIASRDAERNGFAASDTPDTINPAAKQSLIWTSSRCRPFSGNMPAVTIAGNRVGVNRDMERTKRPSAGKVESKDREQEENIARFGF
jgi:hypothetical protein